MINPKTQQFMAGRMHEQIRSSRVDRSPLYTATDPVVDVILETAQESLPRYGACILERDDFFKRD